MDNVVCTFSSLLLIDVYTVATRAFMMVCQSFLFVFTSFSFQIPVLCLTVLKAAAITNETQGGVVCTSRPSTGPPKTNGACDAALPSVNLQFSALISGRILSLMLNQMVVIHHL